jgi:glycine/D-amino acid oxidase-like deaminating enzyme
MRDNLKKGANLQTNTKVTRVEQSSQSSGKWLVESERGIIECSQLVYATNAYTSTLVPSLRGLIRPTPHMCNKIVPPTTFTGSKGLQNSYGVLLPNGGLFSINPRCTSDGIVLFGGSNPGQRQFEKWLEDHPERYTDDGLVDFKPVTNAVQEFAESQFTSWKDSSTASGVLYNDSWSGIIGLVSPSSGVKLLHFKYDLTIKQSADGVPFVGQLPGLPGQWICAGHQGQ